jgi:orotate phosphoribosyltransferase-like protein
MNNIDIRKALHELHQIGMTDKKIGVEIDVSQPTVTRLRNGVQNSTKFETGVEIMKLHERMFKPQKSLIGFQQLSWLTQDS